MRGPIAILCFVASVTVCALALGTVFSGLTTSLTWLAVATGALVAIPAWRQTPRAEKKPVGVWDGILLGAFALASLRAFLWLVYPVGNELRILSPNNMGDLGMHVQFIRYLASGIPFWPDSPILTGVPLSYPLGIDLFNSILELLSVDTFRGLIWVGLAGAALTGWALWRWGGAFGIAALLFNGGLMGFAFFKTLPLQAEDFQSDIVWKNLFLAMFITQRGFLFALPVGLLLLSTWRDTYFREGKKALPYWVQLLLYATMPLFSVHTFIFLSLVLLAIFCMNNRARKPLLFLVVPAVLPATLLMWLVTAKFSVSSDARWLPEWIMKDDGGWSAWIWNFGLALPLVLVLAALLIRERDNEARCLVWTSLLIFVGCCLFALAPWPWDNMKLMMWCWLTMAPYLWSKILSRVDLPARVALCFLLFFSGAISLIGGLDGRHGYSIAKLTELAEWQQAIKDIPPTARFAIAPEANHPVLLLGRKAVCGYPGHLWSHGLPNRDEKLQMLDAALHGRLSWRTAAPALGADWLALRQEDIASTASPDLDFPEPPGNCLYDFSAFNSGRRSTQECQRLQPQSVDLFW